MRAHRSLPDLFAARGRHSFSTPEAQEELGVSAVAARAVLRRLAARGTIATPVRGFHVVVPPEYRRLGCLPPEQFVPDLMAHLGLVHYVGLLSAAEIHGAAHQRPQIFQVLLERPRRALACGSVRVAFIGRKRAALVPVKSIRTPRGFLRVSTVEATACDLAGYPHLAGGLDVVATALLELSEDMDASKLVEAARTAPLTWSQRLGYLLEHVGAGPRAGLLAYHVAEHAPDWVPLDPRSKKNAFRRNPRWRLLVNARVETDV